MIVNGGFVHPGAQIFQLLMGENRHQIVAGLKQLAEAIMFGQLGMSANLYIPRLVGILNAWADVEVIEQCTLCLRNSVETESVRFSQIMETKALDAVVQKFNSVYCVSGCKNIVENCIHFLSCLSRRVSVQLGQMLNHQAVLALLEGNLGNIEKRALQTLLVDVTQAGVPVELMMEVPRFLRYVDGQDPDMAKASLKVLVNVVAENKGRDVPADVITAVLDRIMTIDRDSLPRLLSGLEGLTRSKATAELVMKSSIDFDTLLFSPDFPNSTPDFQRHVLIIITNLLPSDEELVIFGLLVRDFSQMNIDFAMKIQPTLVKLLCEKPLCASQILLALAITMKYKECEITPEMLQGLYKLGNTAPLEAICVVSRIEDITKIRNSPIPSLFKRVPMLGLDLRMTNWLNQTKNNLVQKLQKSPRPTAGDLQMTSLKDLIRMAEEGFFSHALIVAKNLPRIQEIIANYDGPLNPPGLQTLANVLSSYADTVISQGKYDNMDLKEFIDLLGARVTASIAQSVRVPVVMKESMSYLAGVFLVHIRKLGPDVLKNGFLRNRDLAFHICGDTPVDAFQAGELRYDHAPLLSEVFLKEPPLTIDGIPVDDSIVRYLARSGRDVRQVIHFATVFKPVPLKIQKTIPNQETLPTNTAKSQLLKVLETLSKLGTIRVSDSFLKRVHGLLSNPMNSLFGNSPIVNLFHMYPSLFPFEERLFVTKLLISDIYTAARILAKEYHCCTQEQLSRIRPTPLTLTVRRNSLFDDGIVLLRNFLNNSIYSEIRFAGDVGIGMGPTREFFRLMTEEFQRSSRGLFRNEKPSSEFCVNHQGLFPSLVAQPQYFKWLGIFVAKALSMGISVGMDFNPAFFKLTKKEPVTLMEIDDMLAKGLVDPGSLIGLDYSYPGYPDYPLNVIDIDSTIDETNARTYVQTVQDETIKNANNCALSFIEGFSQVVAFDYLKIFSAAEISRIISGDDSALTLDDLNNYVEIGSGYTKQSPQIEMLFQILTEMQPSEQKDFIRFVTGSEILPVGGLKALEPRMQIEKRDGADDPTGGLPLPTASTCICRLKLPAYSTKQLMKEKLMMAVEHCREFLLS